MALDMPAQTEAGATFARLTGGMIETLRQRARQADENGAMQADSIAELQASGVAAAFVPQELGGLGLQSVHDWMLGIANLARGDASVAIGMNMHLGVSRGMAGAYNALPADDARRAALALPLQAIAGGKMLICATATERGTDNLHPLTEATETADGWRIDGHKLFVTMSPLATHIGMNLRMRDSQGDHLATTLLPMSTPGIEPQDDWNALGMRGSGSQSIKFNAVQVGKSTVRRLGPWGQWSTNVLINRTLGNLTLVAAFLGIAEHAYEIVLQALASQTRLGEPVNTQPGVAQLVGEMEIEMATCRSILQRTGMAVDAFVSRADTEVSLAQAHELMKDYQCAKAVVNPGAIKVVSRAMDLVGGAAFNASHPLSRLYRDVRAGPFMQPFSPSELTGYVGKVTLGLYPDS